MIMKRLPWIICGSLFFNRMRKIFIVLFLALLFASCFSHGENDARDTVDSFSVAYFNWRFKDAMPFVSPRSTQWLRYAASQVGQQDLDSLRAKKYAAEVKVEDVSSIDDTTKMATVIVKDFFAMDTIGKGPRAVPVDTFSIPLVMISGYWRVNLNRLP